MRHAIDVLRRVVARQSPERDGGGVGQESTPFCSKTTLHRTREFFSSFKGIC